MSKYTHTQVPKVHIHSQIDYLKENISILIQNKNVVYAASKNLGGLDRRKAQLQLTYTECYLTMRTLYSNIHILNFKMQKKLCETLVTSFFNYVTLVFHPCLDYNIKYRFQTLQNNCCRFIFNLRKFYHISDKLSELKWLNIEK